MRYEVIERHRGHERIVTTTRRENGAANERDIAADSCYQNQLRHSAAGGRVVWGIDPADPNAVVVAFDHDGHVYTWTYTYRPVGRTQDADPDLTDVLYASLVAITAGSL